jgi:membrane associated rhomboid family serine protease/tetratricopeptide (TPR) repeat protein
MGYPVTIANSPPATPFYIRRYRPVATYVLLALNFAVFGLLTWAGGSKNPEVQLNFGASFWPYFRHGEYWRAVMPMFLHIGWAHLLINMYALYLLGQIVEHVYGYGRFSFFYVGSGISGSLASMVMSHHVAAGASGAIMGIVGVMLVAGYLHRDAIPRRMKSVFGRGILATIVATFALGFLVSGIDNWGHFGGLVAGMLLAWIIPPPRPEPAPGTDSGRAWQRATLIPALIVAAAMAAAARHYRAARAAAKLLERGQEQRAAHQLDQAIRSFQEAARLVPADERPHQRLGALYLAQNQPDQAVREYAEALRLNPDDPLSRVGLAEAYQAQGNTAKAQELMRGLMRAAKLTADEEATLGTELYQHKLYEQAVAHLERALQLDPKLAVAHNNLAWLFATSEDPKFRRPRQALEHAQRAVELTNWKQPEFIDTLAEAYYAIGNYQAAVNAEVRALQLAPNHPEYQQHMARYRKAASAGAYP